MGPHPCSERGPFSSSIDQQLPHTMTSLLSDERPADGLPDPHPSSITRRPTDTARLHCRGRSDRHCRRAGFRRPWLRQQQPPHRQGRMRCSRPLLFFRAAGAARQRQEPCAAGRPAHNAARLAARADGAAGYEERLRPRSMRRVHGAHQRAAHQLLPGAGAVLRRSGGHDHRRAGARRRAASDAGRVHQARRLSVRLLHLGANLLGGRHAARSRARCAKPCHGRRAAHRARGAR